MSNNLSSTIKYNRGVGDQRVRQMEKCLGEVVGAVNQIIEAGRGDNVEFVTSVPQSPDPSTLYIIYE